MLRFPPEVAVTVIVAAAFLVVSATAVAVKVIVAGEGTLAGAVYVIAAPDALVAAERVPQAAPVQPVPLKAQLTPIFCESLVTVAVKACVPPTCTFAVGKLRVTASAGGGGFEFPLEDPPHPASDAKATKIEAQINFFRKVRKAGSKVIHVPSISQPTISNALRGPSFDERDSQKYVVFPRV